MESARDEVNQALPPSGSLHNEKPPAWLGGLENCLKLTRIERRVWSQRLSQRFVSGCIHW